MKVACLLITHLRSKVEMRRHPNLKNIDAIIVERSRERSQVVDSTPSASGVSPGNTLEEALSAITPSIHGRYCPRTPQLRSCAMLTWYLNVPSGSSSSHLKCGNICGIFSDGEGHL